MMDKILNGNNNFLNYQYNIMEEYEYFSKLWKMDEVKRCWNSFSHYGRPLLDKKIDGYPYITEMIEDRLVTMNNMDRYGRWTFSRFKAQRQRGDYKLQGWWDKFRAELYKINGVKDVRGYMINISPKWPKKYSVQKYSVRLEQAIIKFANSGKWKEFHYTLECGKNGDHLHAHMVCIPTDPKLAKTYIQKGNHSAWFKREFDNLNNKYPVGFVGCVKGRFSIQNIQINNHEIYKDKLLYLQEETKPEDHKNKSKLMDKREIEFS
jgi:hypothetical protein